MDKIRYGIGIYILRKEAADDLFGVLEKIRECGYDGVELLGFFGKKPGEIRKKMEEIKLAAVGDHVGIKEILENPDRVIGEHVEAGCEYLTIAHGKGMFAPNTPAFAGMVSDMRSLIEKCYKAGIVPLYHNHEWDVTGNAPYVDQVFEALDSLCFEPDIGWMAYSLADPAQYLRRYNKRCPVLHFKDIYADDYSKIGAQLPDETKRDPKLGGFEFRPTGYGTLNYPRLMPLCLACKPKWIVIDHDMAYERDAYDDIRISLEYTKNLEIIAK